MIGPTPETAAKLQTDVVQSLTREGVFNSTQEQAALSIRAVRMALSRGMPASAASEALASTSRPTSRDCFDRMTQAEVRIYERCYVPWEAAEKTHRVPGFNNVNRSDLFLVCISENTRPQDLAARIGQPLSWVYAQLQQSADSFADRS